MNKGRIAKLMKSYGFIDPIQGGDSVFFHRSSLKDAWFADLDEGTIVEYKAVEGKKGPGQLSCDSLRAFLNIFPQPIQFCALYRSRAPG